MKIELKNEAYNDLCQAQKNAIGHFNHLVDNLDSILNAMQDSYTAYESFKKAVLSNLPLNEVDKYNTPINDIVNYLLINLALTKTRNRPSISTKSSDTIAFFDEIHRLLSQQSSSHLRQSSLLVVCKLLQFKQHDNALFILRRILISHNNQNPLLYTNDNIVTLIKLCWENPISKESLLSVIAVCRPLIVSLAFIHPDIARAVLSVREINALLGRQDIQNIKYFITPDVELTHTSLTDQANRLKTYIDSGQHTDANKLANAIINDLNNRGYYFQQCHSDDAGVLNLYYAVSRLQYNNNNHINPIASACYVHIYEKYFNASKYPTEFLSLSLNKSLTLTNSILAKIAQNRQFSINFAQHLSIRSLPINAPSENYYIKIAELFVKYMITRSNPNADSQSILHQFLQKEAWSTSLDQCFCQSLQRLAIQSTEIASLLVNHQPFETLIKQQQNGATIFQQFMGYALRGQTTYQPSASASSSFNPGAKSYTPQAKTTQGSTSYSHFYRDQKDVRTFYCRVLEIPGSATDEEITKAYRVKVREVTRDNKTMDNETVKARMTELNQAKTDALKDSHHRNNKRQEMHAMKARYFS